VPLLLLLFESRFLYVSGDKLLLLIRWGEEILI
jgi:hypothetical protein